MFKQIIVISTLLYLPSLLASENTSWKMTETSVNKDYSVDLQCSHPPTLSGFLPCNLTLTHNSKPVSEAIIKIEGGMPEHHHGLPTSPKITWDVTKQIYSIEGLKFSMPGAWQLKFLIEETDNNPRDIAIFNFRIK